MILTKTIINEAKKWLSCREDGHNSGKCVGDIKRLYNATATITKDAWCAEFVWAIVNEACKALKIDNPLKQTKSTSIMLSEAKKNLRVDNTASKGAIFYYKRTGGGHVGFVTRVSGDTFTTIEGNTNDGAGSQDGVWERKRNINDKDFQFIHLEDLDTLFANLQAPLAWTLSDPKMMLGVGAGVVLIGGIMSVFVWQKIK